MPLRPFLVCVVVLIAISELSLLAQPPEPASTESAVQAARFEIVGRPVSTNDAVPIARVVTWDEILAASSSHAPVEIAEPLESFEGRSPSKSRRLNLPSIATTTPVVSATVPHVGVRFPAADLPTTNVNPPDTMGATGPNHFVELINGGFSVYDKRTGLRLRRVPLSDFFAVVDSFKFDPRIVFDGQSGRWIATAARSKFPPDPSFGVVMAISLTSDPLGDWFQIFFHNPATTDSLHDFPTLGVGPKGIYVEATIFSPGGRRTFWAFEKAPLVANPPRLGAVTQWEYSVEEPRLVAAQSFGSEGGDFAVGAPFGGGFLTVYAIDGPPTSPILVYHGQVPAPIDHRDTAVAPAPNPGQPEPVLLPAGPFLSGAPVYRNRTIWVALRAGFDNRSAVHWLRINPFTPQAQIVDSGVIADPRLSFQHPSVAVNEVGDAVFGFTGSSSSSFPSAYVTGRRNTDPPGATGPVRQTKAGEAPFGVTDAVARRWGDYSATCVDPEDDRTFWTIQQYAGFRGQQDTWGLWVSRVGFDPFDCNHNGVDDVCDIDCRAPGCATLPCARSLDCQHNGVPDECEPHEDCDRNGVRDVCEVSLGQTMDCNENGRPDICEEGPDCNANQIPDECEGDCNGNHQPDECDVAGGEAEDCNGNRVPDECEFAPNFLRSSRPRDGQTLWRSAHNVIRLDFICDLVRPPQPSREITIAQILDDGVSGDDLSGGFSLRVEDDHILRIEDLAGSLRHGRWYTVTASGWPGVQYFSVGLPVLVGDANADGAVSNADLELIDSAIPAFLSADDDRRDINGDGRVLYSDVSAAAARAPSVPPPRPFPR